ncbi:MAG: hypothetical protein AAF212_04650 [Verrucomicrobiota bacterium]
MRIPNSVIHSNLLEQLQSLRNRQVDLQDRISTGQNITRVSDDPSATERVFQNQTEKRDLSQFRRNQERVQEVSRASFAQVERMEEIAARAQEIALLGSSILSDDYFTPYAREVDELIEELSERANYSYLGSYTFAGTATDTMPFALTRDGNGSVTAAAYVGNTATAEVNISENSTLSGYLDPTRNSDMEALFTDLIALRDALDTDDATTVSGLADDFVAHENNMVEALGMISSVDARIENAKRFDDFAFLRADERIANDVDADLASAITEYTRAETAYEAALATSSDLLQRSLFDFI